MSVQHGFLRTSADTSEFTGCLKYSRISKQIHSSGLPSNLDVSLSAQMPNMEKIAPDFIGAKQTNSPGPRICVLDKLSLVLFLGLPVSSFWLS